MNKIVFTNGCFDIIHSGHIELLEKAKALGSKLVVGINSDESVRSIKGRDRPIVSQTDRAAVLIGLESVDQVLIFEEQTPENLIREVKPDVLVKGGDWNESEIVGADFVKASGGEVVSIPLKEGFSSTGIIDRIKAEKTFDEANDDTKSDESIAKNAIESHIHLFNSLLNEHTRCIESCGELVLETLKSGGKVLLCGNGGSAGDAQHIATEIVCRYETERKAYPAIALTTDTSLLTAISNDFSFEDVFSRQIEGLANAGDLLIAISTSGNSPNVIKAVMTARNLGCKTVGLTGKKGKKLAALCDACVMVPSGRTSRIQEAHITIGHIWCELVDKELLA